MWSCQQCNNNSAIIAWTLVLLTLILMNARKHWPGMRWTGRVGIIAACLTVLGGSIAVSYWRGQMGSLSATCGTCAIPALPIPATWPSSQSVAVTPTVSSQPGDEPSPVATSPEVVAFYFHRTLRCHSCLQIEEWAKQVIEEHFANEIANGRVEWRAVNIQEPGNEHFERDYELTAQSLVLVRMQDGHPAEWKNLKLVWDLLGDYARFTEYVQTEVSSFLGSASGR